MTETGRKYKIWEPVLLSIMTIIGMLAGAKLVSSGAQPKAETTFSNAHYSGRQVEEIIRFLETKYVGDVSTDELVNRAIQSIMEGLDPHTHYFPPDQLEALEERTLGHYVGIGVEVAFIRDSLLVLYPKKGSPAEKAGIRPGDYIVAVNGHEVALDTLDQTEILELIKGARGSKVNLTVKPMLNSNTHEVEVSREEIKVPSVVVGYMIDTTVAYIKIQRFTNTTYREFMDQWERMSTQHKAEHLILDLRDNPGGFLKEAVNILSQIIQEEGKLLVYTEGKNKERSEYKSTGKIFFPIGNVAVLINEGSASASEIIAGCVQDQDRGVIIGSRSYGKGLVQEQYELSNGGILRMTISKYYTPSGRLIQKAYDTTTSIVDTSVVFKTAMGRPVYAGGGIVPDVAVMDKVAWSHPAQKEWMDIISEYAIRFNLLNHKGEIVDVKQIKEIRNAFPSDDEIVTELTRMVLKRGKPSDQTLANYLNANTDDLLSITKATLVAYRTGEEGWYIAYNETDPMVLKARDLVKQDLLMALKAN